MMMNTCKKSSFKGLFSYVKKYPKDKQTKSYFLNKSPSTFGIKKIKFHVRLCKYYATA